MRALETFSNRGNKRVSVHQTPKARQGKAKSLNASQFNSIQFNSIQFITVGRAPMGPSASGTPPCFTPVHLRRSFDPLFTNSDPYIRFVLGANTLHCLEPGQDKKNRDKLCCCCCFPSANYRIKSKPSSLLGKRAGVLCECVSQCALNVRQCLPMCANIRGIPTYPSTPFFLCVHLSSALNAVV